MSIDEGAVHDITALTFAQRGVHLPMTTPSLNGARVRRGERHALELLLPNPSGARGRYVLPIDRLDSYCRMTLHDRALRSRLLEAAAVTPVTIRCAAREVAAQGFAGREAAAAAVEADRTDEHERLLTSFALTLQLLRQLDPPRPGDPPLEQLTTSEVERRMRGVVLALAPTLGCTPGEVQQALQELSATYARIGLADTTARAVLERSKVRLIELRDTLRAWARPLDRPGADLATFAADLADATATLAEAALSAARSMAQDLPALLRRRFSGTEDFAALLDRPIWLLDGWDHISLLWQSTDSDIPAELRLGEIMAALPLLPREVSLWSAALIDQETLERRSRDVTHNVDWRTARPVFDLVARNERQRALAA